MPKLYFVIWAQLFLTAVIYIRADPLFVSSNMYVCTVCRCSVHTNCAYATLVTLIPKLLTEGSSDGSVHMDMVHEYVQMDYMGCTCKGVYIHMYVCM